MAIERVRTTDVEQLKELLRTVTHSESVIEFNFQGTHPDGVAAATAAAKNLKDEIVQLLNDKTKNGQTGQKSE